MNEQSLFTQFWMQESKTTRAVFARIPEGSHYRPDPKSRTAQQIAWQIACEELMLIEGLEQGRMQATSPPMPPMPATMGEVLASYDRVSATMSARMEALPASHWEGTLDFFGRARPASPLAWSFLFDIVHHRGQITTYLRPMGSTVPRIYGPSADEP
ncbi:MAG: DinB family protein [Gemmatimonadaceae bacterium]